MEHYWNTRKPTVPTIPTDNITQHDDNSILSDFDPHRLILIANQTEDEGWQSEKCWYLKDLPANVTKDTDIVEWWQVCVVVVCRFPSQLILLITICYRSTVNHTLPFTVLQSTTSPVKLHQCLVNVFSQPGVKLQQNDGLNLGKHCLKN